MRKYLVQYLRNKLEPDRFLLPELNDQYYAYFQKAPGRYLFHPGMLGLAQGNEKIKSRSCWIRSTGCARHTTRRAQNPYDDELNRLEGCTVTPLHVFTQRWAALPTFLKATYSKDELDSNFTKTASATGGQQNPRSDSREDKEKIER